jgi:hypothetical protein
MGQAYGGGLLAVALCSAGYRFKSGQTQCRISQGFIKPIFTNSLANKNFMKTSTNFFVDRLREKLS